MQLRARKANPLLERVLALDDEIEDMDRRLKNRNSKPNSAPSKKRVLMDTAVEEPPAKRPRGRRADSPDTKATKEAHKAALKAAIGPVARGRRPDSAEVKAEKEQLAAALALAAQEDTGTRGARPLDPADKSKGYRPSAEELTHPASPGSLWVFLKAKHLNIKVAYGLRNLLDKCPRYSRDLVGFVNDFAYAKAYILKHTESVNSRASLVKSIRIAMDTTRTKWPPMAHISDEVEQEWRRFKIVVDSAQIKDQHQKAFAPIGIKLEDAQDMIDAHFNNLPLHERYSKAEVLLRWYTAYWPMRDNVADIILVQNKAACIGDHNYLVAPSLVEGDERPWGCYQRSGKTTGEGKLYKPYFYEIATSIGAKEALQKARTVEFNHCLRQYILTQKKNSPTQPSRPFAYGDHPFGVGSLGTFLTDHAKRVGLLAKGDTNGLINHNRKWWDRWGREQDEGLPENDPSLVFPIVTELEMHSAQVADLAYKRGDAVPCGCEDNPANPVNVRKAQAARSDKRLIANAVAEPGAAAAAAALAGLL